ncbi:MAG TPA: chromate resistance protein ChrB domain-containing protein [Candidatus Binatia bacterium]|nr:chromate resistance protein ChrB domain-containing protein [Candidatus Binatia bacterium]
MADAPSCPWLVLIHQLPPKPPYLRVKVWRRLQALGAVPIKNSVYVLPNTDDAREDFEWVLRQIHEDGGDASLCEARLVDGLTDDEVRALFVTAREADYRGLSSDIRTFARDTLSPRTRAVSDAARTQIETAVARFRKRLVEIGKIDFFAAPGREPSEGLIAGLEQRLSPSRPETAPTTARRLAIADVRKRTWVTRKGVHIDRIACAWLIRRFIDPDASFKFVVARDYRPVPGELRFDMFDAEFTHDGDLCSFEVMLRAFALDDAALRAVAEVVHDVDLKEEKFAREESRGIESLLAGLAWLHADDESRVERGAAIFDALHAYFARRKSGRRNA